MKPIILLSFILLLRFAASLPQRDFYPFGQLVGDKRVPNKDEGSTDEVKLLIPFVFFDDVYFSYFINVNGIISFMTEIPYFFNSQFPLDYPVIAPFYSDVDTSNTGNIWYRETADPETIRIVTTALRKNFHSAAQFNPTSVSIITYDSVAPYDARRDKVNTFQVLLITDSSDSYIIFNYADGGLQWLQGDGKTSGLPDALGQAGFFTMDGRLFTLRGSGTDQVRNLDRWSNVDQPGVWMFRVGKIGKNNNIQTPDAREEDTSLNSGSVIETCAIGGTVCHSSGNCVDYEQGFCCRCNEQSYGNGINCFEKDAAIRVNGKVSGNINGIDIIEGDLHSYALANEGRTYTAVSRVPKEVGYDLQTLSGIGEGIAWLFAIPKDGVANGFALTGGLFNRSVEIYFQQSGHKMEIQQIFSGLDVFNNVAVFTTLSGTLPTIPIGSELEVDAFTEEITRVHAGRLRSQSNRSFKLKGQSLETPYTVKTIINYNECENQPRVPERETLRFKVAENIYMRFDEAESIVRFAFIAKIGMLEDEDPCIKGRDVCSIHSHCIVDGDNYRCVCEQGFDFFFDSSTNATICLDNNECDYGQNRCDVNSLCINTEGSYTCQCLANYVGDGRYCEREFTCRNAGCNENGFCEEIQEQPVCKCNVGYSGDGYFCSPDFTEESCHVTQNCSPYAECVAENGRFVCRCLEGYRGNGYRCDLSSFPSPIVPTYPPDTYPSDIFPTPKDNLGSFDPFENVIQSVSYSIPPVCLDGFCTCAVGYVLNELLWVCDPDSLTLNTFDHTNNDPICAKGRCICPDGLVYDQYFHQCNPYEVQSCNTINLCHSNGQCLYYGVRDGYKCTCNVGFTGDGHYCSQIEVTCDVINNCHINALCIYDDYELKSVCVCKNGYSGDGLLCNPADECSRSDDCDPYAQCRYDQEGQKYKCICNEGFKGTGFYCVEEERQPISTNYTGCDYLNNCDYNADCRQFSFGQYQCECRFGFVGNGYSCQETKVYCSVLNNCGLNAECILDDVAGEHQCKCRQGYTGDGFYCEIIQNCLLYPSLCHIYASCESSSLDEVNAACVCQSGFSGNGFNCQKNVDHEKNILLMNQGLSILRMPINNEFSNGFPIIIDSYMTAVGADIDCLTGRYYWTDVGGKSIRSSKYDGTEKIPIISDKNSSQEDVAVDWVSKLIYWTDSMKDIVAVSNIDGSMIRTIIEDDLVNPRGIAVHPGRGLLFWSDWNRDNPKIEVSGMDGSDRKVLVSGSGINLPNSLVVDYDTSAICWADAGTHKIECIGADGHDRRVIIDGIKYPFGLALHGRTFYYTDWNDTRIHEVNKYTGIEERTRRPPPGGSGRLYGIVAVPDQCPQVWNVCQNENGRCQKDQLCLPNGRGGRTCVCSNKDDNISEHCVDYN